MRSPFLKICLVTTLFISVRVLAQEHTFWSYEEGCHKTPDWSTPLDCLIQKLYDKWHFAATGKGHLIGYTDNMFSIAARKDTAIEPLLNIINTSKNLNARIGAIYCMYLISLDGRPGGIRDQVVNATAREALLQSLQYEILQPIIMKLLIRDPWKSDVPALCNFLKTMRSDCWGIVKGLEAYYIQPFPLGGKIPDAISGLTVQVSPYPPKPSDWEVYAQQILLGIEQNNSPFISIEDTLFKSEIFGSAIVLNRGPNRTIVYVREFISDYAGSADWFSGASIGNKMSYYVANDKVYLCSIHTAKQKILDWWNHLPEPVKKQYKENNKR